MMKKSIASTMLSGLAAAAVLLTSLPAIPASAAESKLIALTFDDGPNTTTTNDVLDVLAEYDAKARMMKTVQGPRTWPSRTPSLAPSPTPNQQGPKHGQRARTYPQLGAV